jgi:hypothetical protein
MRVARRRLAMCVYREDQAMLTTASEIKGYAIAASDGDLGKVSDFLFDDSSWLVRWLIVDTSHWITGRKVLLPASALGHPDAAAKKFTVRLTKEQVKSSPDVDSELPVSRQMETNIYDYYGWSPYWGSGLYMGGFSGYMGGMVMPASPPMGSRQREEEIARARHTDGDPHLRSVKAVTGYHIHATDGEIGHVNDFLLEDGDWSVRYLVVDTKNWWPGKMVLISPRSAKDIDWSKKLVSLDVDRQKVKDSPAYDESKTVDRAYEKQFHNYYGDRRPGDRA